MGLADHELQVKYNKQFFSSILPNTKNNLKSFVHHSGHDLFHSVAIANSINPDDLASSRNHIEVILEIVRVLAISILATAKLA